MLQITTEQKAKLVEIDGFEYQVRSLGAGESLTMQKSGRDMTRLGEKKDLSPTEQKQLENLTIELLEICLAVFKPQGDKAAAYIKTLDIEVLMDVINQLTSAKDEQAA